MLSIENFLSESERTEFAALVAQAATEGAQAVRWHSAEAGVLVVGLCSGGQLLTWFASPAKDATEAAVVQAVVLSGIAQAAHTAASLQAGAHDIASSVIKKAMY